MEWLQKRAGKRVKAQADFDSKAFPAMEAAPGLYLLD
jgi:polyhydroxyalkanoate synthase subunit PhaC